jgi:hypothetical protein
MHNVPAEQMCTICQTEFDAGGRVCDAAELHGRSSPRVLGYFDQRGVSERKRRSVPELSDSHQYCT